jgi:2-phospho-L-lactate guanylyltransferase
MLPDVWIREDSMSTELNPHAVDTSRMAHSTMTADRSFDLGADLWAVVPVKDFSGSKERLASALSPQERTKLAESMFRNVLHVLASTKELAGILVVTNDPFAAEIAQGAGAEVIADKSSSGTNAAVVQGLRVLAARDRGGAVVIPADIPLMTREELDKILNLARTERVIVVPAAADGGTNLLLVQPPDLLVTCFGWDSFARHVEASRAAGCEPCVLHIEGIALDIDTPDDLAALNAIRSRTS